MARFSARPDRPWGPPSLLYNGYRVFPGGKIRPGRAADHSPPLVPRSWKSRAIPVPNLWATIGPERGPFISFFNYVKRLCCLGPIDVFNFNKRGNSGFKSVMTSQCHAFHPDTGYQSFGQHAVTAPRNGATREVLNIEKNCFLSGVSFTIQAHAHN